MNQNLYQVLQSIQDYIYQQDRKIQSMQKKIETLENMVTELQNRPPVHVERMEYKFDQLKVETLAGTLNIGLNPSDLQAIEDLSIPKQTGLLTPQERISMMSDLENSMQDYLNKNLPSIIADAGQRLNIPDAGIYHEFILKDIKIQLPNRIDYYLNQSFRSKDASPEQQKQQIIEQLIKEIYHGVSAFLEHLPENMKGKKTE